VDAQKRRTLGAEALVAGMVSCGLSAAQLAIELADAAAVLLYGIGTHGVTSTISRAGACRLQAERDHAHGPAGRT
jgi:hypothetical protein